ncbi:hypothetical protein QBC47DRAFT_122663 [Echria macrotheca]|uniref:RRM domain-containing protein n=1 Tax=Echria macrotheca TaxID=438768 RepID=A0AAJ0B4I3_9PEZI|nr:hypothetical protein QBC47DRAFT_122663 [Echria macrotheca]
MKDKMANPGNKGKGKENSRPNPNGAKTAQDPSRMAPAPNATSSNGELVLAQQQHAQAPRSATFAGQASQPSGVVVAAKDIPSASLLLPVASHHNPIYHKPRFGQQRRHDTRNVVFSGAPAFDDCRRPSKQLPDGHELCKNRDKIGNGMENYADCPCPRCETKSRSVYVRRINPNISNDEKIHFLRQCFRQLGEIQFIKYFENVFEGENNWTAAMVTFTSADVPPHAVRMFNHAVLHPLSPTGLTVKHPWYSKHHVHVNVYVRQDRRFPTMPMARHPFYVQAPLGQMPQRDQHQSNQQQRGQPSRALRSTAAIEARNPEQVVVQHNKGRQQLPRVMVNRATGSPEHVVSRSPSDPFLARDYKTTGPVEQQSHPSRPMLPNKPPPPNPHSGPSRPLPRRLQGAPYPGPGPHPLCPEPAPYGGPPMSTHPGSHPGTHPGPPPPAHHPFAPGPAPGMSPPAFPQPINESPRFASHYDEQMFGNTGPQAPFQGPPAIARSASRPHPADGHYDQAPVAHGSIDPRCPPHTHLLGPHMEHPIPMSMPPYGFPPPLIYPEPMQAGGSPPSMPTIPRQLSDQQSHDSLRPPTVSAHIFYLTPNGPTGPYLVQVPAPAHLLPHPGFPCPRGPEPQMLPPQTGEGAGMHQEHQRALQQRPSVATMPPPLAMPNPAICTMPGIMEAEEGREVTHPSETASKGLEVTTQDQADMRKEKPPGKPYPGVDGTAAERPATIIAENQHEDSLQVTAQEFAPESLGGPSHGGSAGHTASNSSASSRSHLPSQDVRLEPNFIEERNGTVIRRHYQHHNRLPVAWESHAPDGSTSLEHQAASADHQSAQRFTSPPVPPPCPSSLEIHQEVRHNPMYQDASLIPQVDNEDTQLSNKTKKPKKKYKHGSNSRSATPVPQEGTQPGVAAGTPAQEASAVGETGQNKGRNPSKLAQSSTIGGVAAGSSSKPVLGTIAQPTGENNTVAVIEKEISGKSALGGALRVGKQRGKGVAQLENLFRPDEQITAHGHEIAHHTIPTAARAMRAGESIQPDINSLGQATNIHGSFKGLSRTFDPWPRGPSPPKVTVQSPGTVENMLSENLRVKNSSQRPSATSQHTSE